MTGQAGLAVAMNGAYRGADLVVGIRCNIFHQEVDPARIALQDAEYLERAVTYIDLGRFGRFHGLRIAEMGCDVFRQDA